SIIGLEPRVRTSEPAFTAIKDAVLRRQAVSFTYRKPGGDASARRLQPWAVTNWRGRWYVTGYDLDREAPRSCRLGRIEGRVNAKGPTEAYDIPEDHDPIAQIAVHEVTRAPQRATLHVRAGAGHAIRRRARDRAAVDDTWDRLEVDF